MGVWDTRAIPASRRGVLGAAFAAIVAPRAFAAGHEPPSAIAPGAALKLLIEGNARYVAGRAQHPHDDLARRRSLTGGQHPFATVLACADSRTPPELIFDAGLGDLFDVRVAGNVVDDAVLGSIEYSVVHLGVPLVMVLGHQRCGAVTATLDALAGKSGEADRDTHIGALADLIAPAARAVPQGAPDRLDAVVLANARRQAGLVLSRSRPVADRVRAGRLQVVSARYALDDGRVTQVLPAKA